MKVVGINSESSSVKFEVFEASDFSILFSGLLERIGQSDSKHTHRAYGPWGTVKETIAGAMLPIIRKGFRSSCGCPLPIPP